MSTKKFEFDIVSQSNGIVAWAIFAIVIMGMAVMGVSFESTAAALVAVLVAGLFIMRTASVKTQWELDDKGVWVSYLTQGTFVSKPDQGWSWDEIADFELFEERNYSGYTFTFADGATRKYYINSRRDPGYTAFLEAFQLQFGDIQWRRPPAGIITDVPNAGNE